MVFFLVAVIPFMKTGKILVFENENNTSVKIAARRLWESIIGDLSVNSRDSPIILRVEGGLSNRLRALSGGILTAQDIKKPLVLIWEPSIESETMFEDLFHPFQNYPILHRVLNWTLVGKDLDLPIEDIESVYEAMCSTKSIPVQCLTEHRKCLEVKKKTTKFRKPIFIQAGQYISHTDCLSERYVRNISTILRSLILTDKIYRTSLHLNRMGDVRKRLGLHIRMQTNESAQISGLVPIVSKAHQKTTLSSTELRALQNSNYQSEKEVSAYKYRRGRQLLLLT